MAKEKKEKSTMDYIKQGISLAATVSKFKNKIDDIINNLEKRAMIIQKKIIRAIISTSLFALGILLLAIALASYIVEYFKLSKSAAFLIFGIIVILLALIIKILPIES